MITSRIPNITTCLSPQCHEHDVVLHERKFSSFKIARGEINSVRFSIFITVATCWLTTSACEILAILFENFFLKVS